MKSANEISLRERIRVNLVSAMDAAGFSQVQLAKKLGISKGTVNNWIRGNNSEYGPRRMGGVHKKGVRYEQ